MQKAKRIVRILKNPNTIFIGTLALAVLLTTSGYCDGMLEYKSVDTTAIDNNLTARTDDITKFLFGSAVRKVALTLGMGAGLFQAFMSGSVRPLLIYGGLGLVVCYLPTMVDWISKIGGA